MTERHFQPVSHSVTLLSLFLRTISDILGTTVVERDTYSHVMLGEICEIL